MPALNETHDPSLRSWLASANDAATDFPLQNLPFGVFRPRSDAAAPWRVGVAIGDQVLDVAAAVAVGAFDGQAAAARDAAGACAADALNPLLERGPAAWSALRLALSRLLRAGSSAESALRPCLVPQADAQMTVPIRIRDYTDFYIGIHHATAIGKLFRPDNPLLPNYQWVPIGYHGRASSIVVSGTPIRRPNGQFKAPDAQVPTVGPSRRLDIELELGLVVGQGNAHGDPVPMARAEQHLFGIALFNDWSARDIQPWEYQPLGPFNSKNFGSTLAPWIVTMEALAPFRVPFTRPEGDPQPLPYLDSAANRDEGAIDIELEVRVQTARMREAGQPSVAVSRSNFARAAYWTPAQLVAHHTVGGCNLAPGDLFGSGTLSGPQPGQSGSLLELTGGGKTPIALPNGETRMFIEDGDRFELHGWCERAGARRIGFGPCEAIIEPSPALAQG